MHEPFGRQLKAIREVRKTTLEALAYRAQDIARELGMERGPSRDTIAQLEGMPERRPKEATAVTVGLALAVQPGEFPAHDLALARRALDEYEVGFDVALANLEKVRRPLGLKAATSPDAALPPVEKAAGRRVPRPRRDAQQRSA
jgi:transcriptional regulator with XRE-family HTH domain